MVLFLFLFRLFLWSVSLGGGCEKVPWSSWLIWLAKTRSATFTCISSTTTCCCRYKKSETPSILIPNDTEKNSCLLGYDISPCASCCFCFIPILCFTFFSSTASFVVCAFLPDLLQRREVYSNQPRSCQWSASRKLPYQTSLPPEEPVPVANVNQILLAKDWHTVRSSDDGLNVITDYQMILFTENKQLILSFHIRSDKLRWISALSRPHPQLDFSAAQGKNVILFNILYYSFSDGFWLEKYTLLCSFFIYFFTQITVRKTECFIWLL